MLKLIIQYNFTTHYEFKKHRYLLTFDCVVEIYKMALLAQP